MPMFHWETGEKVADISECDYRTTDVCDHCDEKKEGLMMHSRGATGRVCPVLFLCDKCRQPKKGN